MSAYTNTLTKRDCTGDHCPTDISTWKILVATIIPLIFLATAGIYLYGVRNMKKLRQKEMASEGRYNTLDWDDDTVDVASSSTRRANSFYNNQKPGFTRSMTSSSFSTVGPQRPNQGTRANDDEEGPFSYKMDEYSNSMASVPIVKGSSYILPPSDNGDDWGYQDPVTQVPGRAHSPGSGRSRP